MATQFSYSSTDWSYCSIRNKIVFFLTNQRRRYSYVLYSLNVKRVKKRVNANSLEKEWKPLKNSCYPLEKERNEKKSEIFHSKKSEKRVRVNTSEHHSKMYCPLFNSLKNGHSLAESERHSFSSEYSTILLVLLTIHSKRSEVHSQRVNVHSLKI